MFRLCLAVAVLAIAGVTHAANIVGGSALLSGGDASQLETWLGKGTLTMTKIFDRTPGDGKPATDFHTAADERGQTITVMELPPQNGFPAKVIGGYNPQSWNSSGTTNFTDEDAQRTAFLFNLTTGTLQRQKLNPEDVGKYQTYNDNNYGPTFGGGHDLHVDFNLQTGYTNPYSYNAILSGGQGADLTYGTMEVFTLAFIAPSAPSVNTVAAGTVTGTGATLNAKVTSNQAATSVVFEYSTDPTFTAGVNTTSPAESLPGNASEVVVTKAVTGLTPLSTYYFRAVATNTLGTINGVILSFLATDTSVGYAFSNSTSLGGGYGTFGSEFRVTTACTLTHLGTYDHGQDGLAANTPVGLWSASGVLLASTTVLTNDPLNGNSRYHALGNPVTLTADTNYVIGAFINNSDPLALNTIPNFVSDPRIVYVWARYTNDFYYHWHSGSWFSSGFNHLHEGGGFLQFPTTSSNGPTKIGANFLLGPAVTAPLADAGPLQTVTEGAMVTLNGTASQDTNSPAHSITYAWTQLVGPDVTATFTDTNTATPGFTAPSVSDAGASLVFQLTVSNGSKSSSATVTVSVVHLNNPPIANAGPDQLVGEKTLVTLNAAGGYDSDLDPITLHWSQVPGFGPSVQIIDADTLDPTFTAPDVTFAQDMVDLKFQLVVNDGKLDSGPSTVIIHVKNTNDAPIADAGPNQSVNELDPVTLNGTASGDPDSDALTYSWTQILTASPVALTGADTATPSFTAPELNIGGVSDGTTLTFQLIVNDGKEDSATSEVNVRVSNVNHAPLADAGQDQTVPEATEVALNGALSADVDGDMLTYAWAQPDGQGVALSGTNTAEVSFTTPDTGPAGAVLHFTLTVDDGYGGTHSDEVIVNVVYVNHPPTATAGAPLTVNEGDTATLAGTASDPDGNVLGVIWSKVSGPEVTILNGSTLTPSFAAPLVTRAGDNVVLRLTVDDSYGGIVTSDVTVHIANINRAPTAQAPANMSVPEASPVELIGQGTDPDSEEQSQLTYSWQQIAPDAGSLVEGANLSITAPLVTAGGDPDAKVTLTFRFTTTDPNGVAATDDVDVVVTNVDHAPTANAGGNLTANEAASVTMNGSASSDPDGDALTYAWVQTAGPAVTLNDANTAYPYFTVPFVSAAGETLKFQLTVDDGFDGASSDAASVTISNINDPPTVTGSMASLGTLWPPDHSMVKVSILGVVDPNNNATVVITGVTQDEATNGLGDGDTAIDAIINADGTSVLLRAERSGKGDGRVYRVSFTASDYEGSSSGVVKVVVPKSKKTDVAIDSGVSFDSTR